MNDSTKPKMPSYIAADIAEIQYQNRFAGTDHGGTGESLIVFQKFMIKLGDHDLDFEFNTMDATGEAALLFIFNDNDTFRFLPVSYTI